MLKAKPYEKISDRVAPRAVFRRRLFRHALFGAGLILFELAIGMAGYMQLEGLSLVDAFENAAMIIAGMGPVNSMTHTDSKIFAGLFAICAGVLFMLATTITLAPVFHRLLHKFHADDSRRDG